MILDQKTSFTKDLPSLPRKQEWNNLNSYVGLIKIRLCNYFFPTLGIFFSSFLKHLFCSDVNSFSSQLYTDAVLHFKKKNWTSSCPLP